MDKQAYEMGAWQALEDIGLVKTAKKPGSSGFSDAEIAQHRREERAAAARAAAAKKGPEVVRPTPGAGPRVLSFPAAQPGMPAPTPAEGMEPLPAAQGDILSTEVFFPQAKPTPAPAAPPAWKQELESQLASGVSGRTDPAAEAAFAASQKSPAAVKHKLKMGPATITGREPAAPSYEMTAGQPTITGRQPMQKIKKPKKPVGLATGM